MGPAGPPGAPASGPAVAVTSPLVSSGLAITTISIPPATASADGFLTSSDWSLFNSKVSSTDPRLSDPRAPTAGSAHYIQNQTATPQSAGFNITGNATVGSTLQVDGDAHLGPVFEAANQAAGPGKALHFSGAPDVCSWCDNENTDSMQIRRFNVAGDVSELQVVVGDNAGSGNGGWNADKFVVGAFDNSYAFVRLFSVDTGGVIRAKGTVMSNGTPDLAETISAASSVSAADVVCADPHHRERVVRCGEAGARTVMGVIADGTSSFLINSRGRAEEAALTGQPLVLAGRVPVKVSLENGPIHIGDQLTPSSRPGVAMRASGPGAVVGIALGNFDAVNPGEVLCFVSIDQGNAEASIARLEEKNRALEQRLARLEKLLAR